MAAQDLRIRISADGSAAIVGMRKVQDELGRTGRSADELNGGFGRIAAGLKGLALTAAAALGVSNLAQSFTAANVAAGTLRAGLETVTGSAKAGAVAWAQLQAFAAQTPFSLQQATEGFIKLKAMGLDPSREALLSYANTASAMGKDLSMMIEAVVDASNSSFERLREFGITASQEGDKVSLTFQGVTTTIGNNAAEIEAYLRRIGEVQFAGAIERQSENLGVALSNVGDAWDQLMVEVGDAGLTAVLVEGLQEVTGWISALKGEIADGLGADVSVTLTETISLFEGWSAAVSGIPPLVRDLGAALAELPNYTLIIRDGTLAIEEQGTAWEAVAALVAFAGEAFLDLPDNLRAAVFIILGEIDVLTVNFQSGMEQLPIIAAQAWAAIQNAIASAIGTIKIAVAEMVAYVAGQLASLATDMAGVMAQIPEALDIGGMASAAAASLTDLASSLKSTEDNVADLKAEQAALGDQYEQDAQALKGQQEAITARAETEIAAIRGVIQAGIEEAKAKKTARKAQADLNAEFAKAVADQAALERQSLKTGAAITGGGKAASGAAKSTKDLANAKGGAAKASKELEAAQRAETQAMAAATRTVDGLVQKYLPAKAAAQDYQESMAALAKAGEAVGLSQAELSVIAEGLAKDQAKAADAARRESDAFYAAWADAVDSLDSTFQGLWRSLITGQGDVLGNLKETVLEWVADLSYQLLLSPLIVPIQGALMGIMGGGAAGVTGTATSMLGTASSLGSMFSGFSSLASGVTSLFSGATAAGITAGWGTAMAEIGAMGYGGAFTTIMGQAGSLAASGNIAASIGAAAPYLLPAIVAIGGALAIFNKWQSDQEPRYGTLAAMTGGRAAGLEDAEWGAASGAYVKGSFGLNFGITDKGSKNMEATELTEVYQALADVSDALAEFFGEDLSAFIEAELQKMSDFGDGLIHLTENEGDLGGAMAALVERIAQAAGRSAEDIGIAFGAMVGDLSGTAEEVGEQIQAAMLASSLAVQLSDRYDDDLGQMLDLTGDITADVKLLKGYIDQFGTSGETSGETLSRLVAQLGVLDTAAQQTATNLEGLSATALLTLSDELVGAFGGVEAATQAQAFYYEQFTTGTEKLVDAIQAAADQIDREIPKLQDELLGLSEDVTTTATQVVEEIQKGISGVELPGAGDSGNYWAGMHDKLVDRFGEDMARMLVSIHEESNSVADGVDEYWAKMRDKLVDRFGEDLVRMIDAVHGTAEDAIKNIAAAGDKVSSKTITTETTVKGDPNAAILARLLDDLPKTRDGFKDLIGAIDLTTEAGRKLYAGLMELAPQFDLLYDGAEAFTDWLLGVDAVGRATADLTAVFAEWGLSLPGTRDALLTLYDSGILTTEQMAILGAYLKELGLVFGDLGDTTSKIIDYTNLQIRLAEAQGDANRALTLRRQQELKNAADDTTRAILRQIYALEDETAAREAARRKTDGVKAFTDWLLGVDEVGQATRELEAVFKDWGMTLPENRDALKDLYDSGILTTEQMAILGAYLKELGLVFGDLKDDVDGINELDLSKLRDAYAVLEQAARAEREAVEEQYQARMDAIAAEREALDAQHQARLAAIASEREAVNAAYQARMDGIAAEREAAQQANQAQLDALAKQREAAQEALAVAEAGLSRIQSALDAFRGDAPRNEMERMRALRQLGAWARAGTLPGEEQLDRAITGATNLNAEDFGTEAAYRAAQGSAYSALLALEKVGVRQVSDAERQIAAIETASDRAAAAYEAQLAAIDAQAEQAAGQRDAALEILARQEESATAWRDQELARLEAEAEAAETWREENLAAIDALLELAAKQIAILEGTYVETKTLAEAIKDFNAALIDAGGEPLSPTQEGLDALLPPMTELVAASTATTTEVVALRQEIVTLRRDLADVATAQVVPLKAIDERLRKWDLDGLPGDSTTETALRAA